MFIREGSITLLAGILLGLLLAAAAGKLVSGMLYEVGTLDPVAFVVAPFVLALAALVATWLPARRATKVNPLKALRTD
jgi:ABC-type antimicrobial peptide transport system permease subunit